MPSVDVTKKEFETTGSISKVNPINSANILLSTKKEDPLTSSYSPRVPRRVICVFCGSSSGNSSAHIEAARSLAHTLHSHKIDLIYGGGTLGLMGELAKTLVSLSGPDSVHGIIPAPFMNLSKNSRPSDLPDFNIYGNTTVVKDMQTRKQMMVNEVSMGAPGSGFIALSGGYGTFEELMEVATYHQIGIHDRGVIIYNVEGFWNSLLEWIRNSLEAGFVGPSTSSIILEAKTAEQCVELLSTYKKSEGMYNFTWDI
ncbi:putative lysine decarboxylase protein [Blumeria hordei DH14]|uniref:Putative lysine decarboxylase protein n=1 Tax=Blumeria graminis f. sp. hordei (strain DH14) TaxID=546991 RepID=N1JK53_BLUG1|nr:putative lysine decarboxylase protein [Blumeria hordei DH14]